MGGGSSKHKLPQAAEGLDLRNDEKRMLQMCLYRLPFPPGTITAATVAAAAKAVERVEYMQPINVLTKGDRAKGIYILVKGHARVLSSTDDVVADLNAGSFFGEISTLFYVPVTATVQTTVQTQVLLLKEETLRKAIGEVVSTDLMDYYVKQRYFDTSKKLDQGELMNRIAIATLTKIPLFSKWKMEAVSSLVKQCQEESGLPYPMLLIQNMSTLVMEEDKSEEMVIITRGKVEIMREKESIALLDAERWPVWIGEEGLFTNTDNLCAMHTIGACQAIKLNKSTIQNILNKYKAEAGQEFGQRSKVWQTRFSLEAGMSDRHKAEMLLPVLINTLSKLGMFSSAHLAFLYDVAMLNRPKMYADSAVIVDGTGKPAKIRKALQASLAGGPSGSQGGRGSQKKQSPAQQGPQVRTVKGAEAATAVADNDVFLLPLRGEIGVDGVPDITFKEKAIINIPQTQLKEIKLIAKGETLVLTIGGSRLLGLCNLYPDVQIMLPPPVL